MKNFPIIVMAGAVFLCFGSPEYEGIVDYGRTTEISFEEKGRISYVIPSGSSVQGGVFDSSGNPVLPGELLAQQQTVLQENDVRTAELQVRRAKSVLEERKSNFLRDKQLALREAVSQRTLQDSEMQYETARIDLQKCEALLDRAKEVLAACFIRAPYNAVVEDVYRSEGSSVDVATPVLKIRMIDPVRIIIDTSPEDAEKIRSAYQISIIPSGSTVPVPAWLGPQDYVTGKVVILAANPVVEDPESAFPVFSGISRCMKFPQGESTAPLWINVSALNQLADGSCFVWQVLPENEGPVLKRRTIQPKELFLKYGNSLWRGIAEGSGLRDGDLLAGKVSPGTQDGERGICRSPRRRFRAGERVRILIQPGFSGQAGIPASSGMRELPQETQGIRRTP